MSLTSLSAAFALALSTGLWLWPTPQPIIHQEAAPPAPPPAPPSVFDCRCECPAPTPCPAAGGCTSVEVSSCSWTTSLVTFLAGCLVTALAFCVGPCCRRAFCPSEPQFVQGPIYVPSPPVLALPPSPAAPRPFPKALTASQRRAALGNR
jgi:hypothetical protein